ncbi:MAG: T9SS type A sorting domain-containing protein [Bacteroidales bacterium]
MKKLCYLLLLISTITAAQDNSRYLLDSIYHIDFDSPTDSFVSSKAYQDYDLNGNLTSYIHQNTNDTEYSYKAEFTYDPDGNKTSETQYFYNTKINDWGYPAKILFEYSFAGKLLLTGFYQWDTIANTWEYDSKIENEYDEYGNKVLTCTHRYNHDNKEWQGVSKEESTYNEGKITLFLRYTWDPKTSEWINEGKCEFTYFAEMYVQSGYHWDTQISQWAIYYKHKISYDPEGRIFLTETYDFDEDSGEWKYNNTVQYEYDNDGRETQVIYSIWHNLLKELTPYSKLQTTYNDKGLKATHTSFFWDTDLKKWNLRSLEEYLYDSCGNNTTYIKSYWSINDNQWNLEDKTHSYYSLHPISHLKLNSNKPLFNIYPNPACEVLFLNNPNNINSAGIIYNSTGKPVLEIEICEGLNTFDLRNLTPGLYIIKIMRISENNIYKLIKK